MQTTKEKVSYCIGLETGKNLRRQFTDIDFSRLLEGFEDAVKGGSPKLQDKEIESVMKVLRQQIEKQQRDFVARLSEQNKKMGEDFLFDNKHREDVVTLPSGLQYRVIQSGEGSHPKSVDTVKAHYQGKFLDGQVFDSSYERKEPAVFAVNRVIPGWSEVLQLMTVGDKWEVFIPHYLAYGEAGFGNEIGPNATLIFEIELLAINP